MKKITKRAQHDAQRDARRRAKLAARRPKPGRKAYDAENNPNREPAIIVRGLIEELGVPYHRAGDRVIRATAPGFAIDLVADTSRGSLQVSYEVVSAVQAVDRFANKTKALVAAAELLFRRATPTEGFRLTEEVSFVRHVIRGTREGNDTLVRDGIAGLLENGWRPVLAQLAGRAALISAVDQALNEVTAALGIKRAPPKERKNKARRCERRAL